MRDTSTVHYGGGAIAHAAVYDPGWDCVEAQQQGRLWNIYKFIKPVTAICKCSHILTRFQQQGRLCGDAAQVLLLPVLCGYVCGLYCFVCVTFAWHLCVSCSTEAEVSKPGESDAVAGLLQC